MQTRLVLALLVGFSLIASLVPPVASAQDQTSWYVNDNPQLNGPSQYWWAGDAGKGYGSNNYVYTYGTAGESSADNWARWSMGRRVGRQEIQVYVPNTRATATVLYRVDIGSRQYTKRVAQRNAYGWTGLGTYDVDGASVTITLRDNDASQHWNRNGYSSSSIGVDAAAMRCISRCSTTQATPVPTAAPTAAPRVDEPSRPTSLTASPDENTVLVSWSVPSRDGGASVSGYRVELYRGSSRVARDTVSSSTRSAIIEGLAFNTAYQVRVSARNSAGYGDKAVADFRTEAEVQTPVVRSVDLSLGADRSGCSDRSNPCRWLRASYSGFSQGSYSVQCYWSTSSSSRGTRFASFTTSRVSGTNASLCWFNGTPGRYLTVVVDGVSSNTVRFAGTAPAPTPTPTPRPTATPTPRPTPSIDEPAEPRSLSISSGNDSVLVSWSAPSRDGGAAVSGYRVDLYRGSSRVERKNLSGSARSATFSDLAAGTAYQVRVSARNSAGYGDKAVANTRTLVPAQQQQVRRPGVPRGLSVSAVQTFVSAEWSAPSSDGGGGITGYRVDLYRGGARVARENVSGSATSQGFAGLAPGTAYQVRVSARNSAGYGDSAVANTRTPPAPTPTPKPQVRRPGVPRGLSVSAVQTFVSAEWSAPSSDGGGGITGYRVDLYRGGARVARENVSGSATSQGFAGLAPDTAYQVRVSARNSAGYGDSAVANTRTEASAQQQQQVVRSVDLSLGADRSGCSDQSMPCRWLSASYSGFSPGSYSVQCYWSTSSSSRGTRFASFTTSRVSGSNASLCWFNGTPGRYLTVVVDGVSSNTVRFAGTAPAPTPTPTPRPTPTPTPRPTPTPTPRPTATPVQVPSAPRSLQADADQDSVTIRWSPPSNNGGSPLTGYQVELYRGSRQVDLKSTSTSSRSASFNNLSSDMAYTILISARNNRGLSSPSITEIRTEAIKEQRSVTIGLGADRSGCSDQSNPCRWLTASYSGFTASRYGVQCYSSMSSDSLGTRFASFTANTSSGADSTLCWFNGTPGRYLTVVVDGVRSNTVKFAGTAPSPAPTPVSEILPPSVPRSVEAISVNRDQIKVTWDPPSDSGGSPISHYRVTFSRSRGQFNETATVGGSTSYTYPPGKLLQGLAYDIRVIAVNDAGLQSVPVTTAATTNIVIIDDDPISVDPPPKTGTQEEDSFGLAGSWDTMEDECDSLWSLWRCGAEYYISGDSSATATAYMGDLQGTFSFWWLNPKDKVSHLGGRAVWSIYEKRTGSDKWRLVRRFKPSAQSSKPEGKWRGYPTRSLELDGEVKIEMTHNSRHEYGTIAIKKVRLRFDDVLPELKVPAQIMCEMGVKGALDRILTGGLVIGAVAAAALIVYFAPLLLASYVAPFTVKGGLFSSAGLLLFRNLIIKKAGMKALEGLIPLIIKPDEDPKWLLEAIRENIAKPVLGFVSNVGSDIYNNALESYSYGCREFRASALYLNITRGYGSFADDLAKVWGRRR